MLVQLLGVFAEFERATIIDRVIAGMKRKAAWAGGTVTHGLRLDADKRLAAEPEKLALVRRVFDRYGNGGLGAARIAAELNDDGYRTRTG